MKKTGKRPKRGQTGRPAKYQPRYVELVKMYIIELGAINSRGEIAWGRIAKAMGLNVETLRRWRTKSNPYYKQDFAIAVTQAVEEIDTGRIKAGQIVQAQKHILHRVTREPRIKGPKMPSSSYTKALLIRYANDAFKIQLDMKMTIPEIRYKLERRIEELTEEKMVIVKKESIEVDPNPAAVKLVLTNLGKKKERWNFKEQHEIDTSDPLTQLLKDIAEQPMTLPSDEIVKEDANNGTIRRETKEPVLAAEQSVLDHG